VDDDTVDRRNDHRPEQAALRTMDVDVMASGGPLRDVQ